MWIPSMGNHWGRRLSQNAGVLVVLVSIKISFTNSSNYMYVICRGLMLYWFASLCPRFCVFLFVCVFCVPVVHRWLDMGRFQGMYLCVLCSSGASVAGHGTLPEDVFVCSVFQWCIGGWTWGVSRGCICVFCVPVVHRWLDMGRFQGMYLCVLCSSGASVAGHGAFPGDVFVCSVFQWCIGGWTWDASRGFIAGNSSIKWRSGEELVLRHIGQVMHISVSRVIGSGNGLLPLPY